MHFRDPIIYRIVRVPALGEVLDVLRGGEAFVGWFEGDSAVVVHTWFVSDNRTAIGYLDDLAAIVKRYAPQLLAITGFGPSPTSSFFPPAVGSSESASSPPPPTSSPDEQTDGADG